MIKKEPIKYGLEIKENSGTAIWHFALTVAAVDGKVADEELERLLKSYDFIADVTDIETSIYSTGESKEEFEKNQLKLLDFWFLNEDGTYKGSVKTQDQKYVKEAAGYLTRTSTREWAIGLAMAVVGADDLAQQENDVIKSYIEKWGLDKNEIESGILSALNIHIKYTTLPSQE